MTTTSSRSSPLNLRNIKRGTDFAAYQPARSVVGCGSKSPPKMNTILESFVLKRLRLTMFCVCAFPIAVAAQPWLDHVPAGVDVVFGDAQSRHRPDWRIGTSDSVLGPDQQLLQPYIATQTLQGDAYVEWCLRWNTAQYHLAARRSIPARTIRGSVSSQSSFSQGNTGGFGFRRPTRVTHSYHSTGQSREQVWRLDGYGGGPVNLYNPFVTR